MKNILIIFIINVFLSVWNSVNAQPTLELSVANQAIVGTDFYFDVQMQATSGSVYLGSADLILTFNSENFESPVITKGTFGTYFLNNTTGDNETQTGSSVGGLYRSLVSTASIVSNEIIINLNLLPISDQETFNSDIAKIDNSLYTFGTYKISGVTNPAGTMGLAWKTTGSGVKTNVLSYSAAAPWNFSLVTLSTPAILNVPLPIELASLTAAITDGSVNLYWITETEINNYGFEIERLAVKERNPQWKLIGFVEGNGNSNSPKEYSFVDVNPPSGDLEYRLKQIDLNGDFKYYPAIAEISYNVTDVIDKQLPTEFGLSQNYPNPFNPVTTISYQIPVGTRQGVFVQLYVYDILGNEVAILVNDPQQPGYYNVKFDGSNLSSGVYIYRLTAGSFTSTKKLMLMK